MEQLLLTLHFFHQKKILHRDIKLDNILINKIHEDEYDIRVADFGLATFTPNDEYISYKCGTPGYVAPEILKGEGYSYKADIFSMGSLFFNILTGRYLFHGANHNETLALNLDCKIQLILPHLKGISKAAQRLLLRMI